MNDLERAKLEALAEFAAGAGHEINNPLAVISGRAQLLLRDEPDPERRRDLATIHVQALRIRDMIADLMLFARPPQPERCVCDVVAIAAAAVKGLAAKADNVGARLERTGESGPIEISADPEQLQVALRALVDNGLNAVARGGRVSVEIHRTEGGVKLAVGDDGPGLTTEAREHAFDPFYSGRQAGRGIGMGLSKAWRIVTNHGGTIDVPETSRGATFVVRLPGTSYL
jgi:signal transduction histidine kinase